MEVLEDSPTTETGSSLRNNKDYALNLSISVEFPNHLLLSGQAQLILFFFF